MWRLKPLLSSSAIAAAVLAGFAAATQEQSNTRFKAATTAITVDVVVRDQRGRPVTDLGRADFQLLEDGVSQQIGDLTLVADSPQTGSTQDQTPRFGANATAIVVDVVVRDRKGLLVVRRGVRKLKSDVARDLAKQDDRCRWRHDVQCERIGV